MQSAIGVDIEKLMEHITRDQAAEFYAKFIMAGSAPEFVFQFLNILIVHKWSIAGLTYIKEKAWKLAEAQGHTFN